MAMGKALVVGASGLVGGALMRALRAARIDCVGTYGAHPQSGLVALDITSSDRLRACLERHRPETIFLAAALTHVDYCEDHPGEAFKINLEGPGTLAEAARAIGAQVVYYSTDYVFDGKAGPYDEEAHAAPLSVYGRTKLAAERALQEIVESVLILRTTGAFGWDLNSKNFAMQVYYKVRARERMTIPMDQFGNPTLAEYLAEMSLALAQQGVRGIVNVVGEDLIARSEFARALVRLYGGSSDLVVPVPTESLKQKAARPLFGGLRTEKLERLVGRKAMALDDALKRLAHQWKDCVAST
ncbi:MAG: SDR family oxidoreductase [Deltaproteobacteria bacterium]|nr:SDR family oxidoreductase [Deltaproteobacteria bacterium]MDZ4345380.1 SDR family oxidoreductase [Candidatus Binatia bacterium]